MRYIFTIFFACSFFGLCHAADIITEIIAVKKPTSVIFIDNVRYVVAGDGCIFVDLIKRENRILDTTQTYHVALNKNQTRFATSSKKKLAIHSAFTGEEIWRTKPIFPNSTLAFSSIDPILFAYSPGSLTAYKYLEKKIDFQHIPSLVELPTALIACHPTEKKLLYPSSETTLSTIDFDDCFTIKLMCTTKEALLFGTYSPDGNYIAINNDHKCCLYQPDMHFCYPIPDRMYRAKTISLAFHPYRPILAILLDNNALKYINYKTKELIAIRMRSPNAKDWIKNLHPTERLSFSPKDRLMIALKDKCLIMHVPKNNILAIYHMLKTHKILPDLIKFIFHKIAFLFKFHHINFIELMKT